MRVLLATPTKDDQPLGLMYLSSVLKQKGHEVRGVMLRHQDIFSIVANFKPSLIGFSVMTGEQKLCLETNAELKAKYNFFSLWGGPHATFATEDLIVEEGVDAVCQGEGEQVILEVVRRLEAGETLFDVNNLYVKENGQLYRNPLRPLMPDLDVMPFPDRDLFREFKEDKAFNLMASRGCPYKCSYCFNHRLNQMYKGNGKIVRYRSVQNVITELQQMVVQDGAELFNFHDDLFTISKKWFKDFAKVYGDYIRVPYICSVRVEHVDEAIGEALQYSGCHQVFMGLEAGNDEIRGPILDRKMSKQDIIDCVHLLNHYGINVITQNMVGIPGATLEHDYETLELNIACQPYFSWVSICTPYPNTNLADRAKALGVIGPEYMSKIYDTYHYRTILDIPHARQVDNLHKLFSIAAHYPELLPKIRELVEDTSDEAFEYYKQLFLAYRNYYYELLTDSNQVFPQIVRDFLEKNGVIDINRGSYYPWELRQARLKPGQHIEIPWENLPTDLRGEPKLSNNKGKKPRTSKPLPQLVLNIGK